MGLLPFPVYLFCLRWLCCRFQWVCFVSDGSVAVFVRSVLSLVGLLPFLVGLSCLRWVCCRFRWVCSVSAGSVAVSGGSVLSPVGFLPFPMGLFCLQWVCCRFRWVCFVSGEYLLLFPGGLLLFSLSLYILYTLSAMSFSFLSSGSVFFPVGMCCVSSLMRFLSFWWVCLYCSILFNLYKNEIILADTLSLFILSVNRQATRMPRGFHCFIN